MRIKPHLLSLTTHKTETFRSHIEVLSGILLAGWRSIDQKTGDPCITNAEMREVLLNTDDDFRSQILWHLKGWSSKQEAEGWGDLLPVFLSEVWPKHTKVKSPENLLNSM